MANIKLEIDCREPKDLINILREDIENTEVKGLELGDFLIKDKDDNILVILERKSLADLLSSIKDGRYAEQSFRLNKYPLHNHCIYYIIEGDLNNFILKNNEINQKTLFSALFSLSYYKGFSIIKTTGIIETGEIIKRFIKKLEGEKRKPYYNISLENRGASADVSSSFSPEDYSNTLKMSKKSNITKNNIGEIMLSQIPGVSLTCSKTIMVKYLTIKNLIVELEGNSACLDNLIMECKNSKRKISKTAIKNIKEYLIN